MFSLLQLKDLQLAAREPDTLRIWEIKGFGSLKEREVWEMEWVEGNFTDVEMALKAAEIEEEEAEAAMILTWESKWNLSGR